MFSYTHLQSEAVVLATAEQAPTNDDWANREPISGDSAIVTGTLAGATVEPGEAFAGNSPTVWYSWTAPFDGYVLALPATLADEGLNPHVFEGSPFAPGAQPILNDEVLAGHSYSIQVQGVAGDFTLRVTAKQTVAVTGTGGDDEIRVTVADGRLHVFNDGQEFDYDFSKVGNVVVRTGGGNDAIFIGEGVSIVPKIYSPPGVSEGAKVFSGSGDDTVYGGSAQDTIYSGLGKDIIYAGSGADLVYGGVGADVIHGGRGRDEIHGKGGADTVYGGWGQDYIAADAGADLVRGGLGDDRISGGWGADSLYGGIGNDHVSGGEDNDMIYGNDGDDWLSTGTGYDQLSTGAGADQVRATTNAVLTDPSADDVVELNETGTF